MGNLLSMRECKHSDANLLRIPPRSALQLSLGHSSETRQAYFAQDGEIRDSETESVISKEAIWSNFVRILPPAIRPSAVHFQRRVLERSIAPAAGKPMSHAVKRASQEWWLAHPSQPWEHILSQENQTVSLGCLSHIIFLSWYHDLVAGLQGSDKTNGDWLYFLGPSPDHDVEAKLVEQLVDDIYKHLNEILVGSVKRIPTGVSTSTDTSISGTTELPTCSQPDRVAGKRPNRDESEPDDKPNDDDPDKNERPKRIKKNADQYSHYFICTEFAAGQDPACPNCFFGAWPSVDRLKRDHLVKVHKFDSIFMKVDKKGGTESEKWWRLFDKLHPGFRERNPDTFIPGPLWEDRVAHNAYNKVLSVAMKEAECIRQRGTQALISQFQDLLNRQQNLERQELRHVVSSLLYSNILNMTVIDSRTPAPAIERQPATVQTVVHNGERCNGIEMITHLLEQPDVDSTHSSMPEKLSVPFSFNTASAISSSNGPPLDNYLPTLQNHNVTSSRQLIEDSLGTGTYPSSASPVTSTLALPGFQISPPNIAMSTTASSETMSGTDHFHESTSSSSNDHGAQQPFGKVCRCRFHSLECADSCAEPRNEWCLCCSGWFPWSAMADPFF